MPPPEKIKSEPPPKRSRRRAPVPSRPADVSETTPDGPTEQHWPGVVGASRRIVKNAVDFERQLLFSLNPSKWPNWRQLRHGYRIFSKHERLVVVTCIAVITAALVWLGAAAVFTHIQESPTGGGTFTEGIVGQPQLLNPLYATNSSTDTDLTRLIFAGLFRYDKNLNVIPDLADNYTVSDDGKIYTVTLRDHLVWQDGQPLSVDDVIFTFSNITNPDVASPLAASFQGVVVEKIDTKTVRFTLRDPYPAFVNLLTTGLIPKHVWAATTLSQWSQAPANLQPIGAGPWQIDTFTRDPSGDTKQIILVHATPQGSRHEAYFYRLVFKFYPDLTSAEAGLDGHAIDGLAFIPSREPQDQSQGLTANYHVATYDITMPAITSVFFNLNVPSPAQTLAVRQALQAIIDKADLIKQVLGSNATLANGPFPPGASDHPTVLRTPDAESLLASAGWQRVGALWSNKQGETLHISLAVVDRQPERRVAEYIQQRWQHFGIDTKIDLISPADPAIVEQTLLRPRSYQALLYTTVYGAMVDPYPFWHSSERVDPGLNLSSYSNKKADDDIEQARRALTEADRRKALDLLQQQLSQDVPAIFLYSPIEHYVVNSTIKGVSIGRVAMPADRFNDLEDWYVQTKHSLR